MTQEQINEFLAYLEKHNTIFTRKVDSVLIKAKFLEILNKGKND
jgi:hypothetical protein